jgi:hypothetical protein
MSEPKVKIKAAYVIAALFTALFVYIHFFLS